MAEKDGMTALEKRTLAGLSLIFAIRMFGLFIVLPVISLYARTLPGADPLWLGLALGGYGLSQAIFQVPFGMLSDRFGRKPVIVAGLLIFAGGSVMAATAHSVFGLFVGRLIQGTGAVASVVIALMADLTREEYRTRAMAGIGVSIGLSFAVGMVVGPIVGAAYGVSSLFAPVSDAKTASQIKMSDLDPGPGELSMKGQQSVEGIPEGGDFGELGTDVLVDPHDLDARKGGGPLIFRHRPFDRNPELRFFHAGGDVGMGLGIDVGIDPQGDRSLSTQSHRHLTDMVELVLALHVEHEDLFLECIGDLLTALANAGKDDLIGGDSRLSRPEKLPARHDIDSCAFLGQEREDGQVAVGLHGIGHESRVGGKRFPISPNSLHQGLLAVNVERRTFLLHNLFHRQILNKQTPVSVFE